MNLWWLIAGMALISFVNRASFILLIGRFDLPRWLRGALRFVPAAAITSVTAPSLFLSGGSIDLSPANLRLLAGAIAALVAWRTHSPVATIAAGMAALYALRALLG